MTVRVLSSEAKLKMAEGRKKSLDIRSKKYKERIDSIPFEKRSKDARRAFLLEKQNGKCLECGLDEWQGKPIVLEYDHINGNNSDQTLENARLLCPNCHSQTETFRKSHKNKVDYVSDDKLVSLLTGNTSIYMAIKQAKLPNTSYNYKRCNNLIAKFKISML